jgi:hypothetical protein
LQQSEQHRIAHFQQQVKDRKSYRWHIHPRDSVTPRQMYERSQKFVSSPIEPWQQEQQQQPQQQRQRPQHRLLYQLEEQQRLFR